MSDIKLFKLSNQEQQAAELSGRQARLEKHLQSLVEAHMETMLGVKFLASEYNIRDGRIDSIGIDNYACPVIVEYKRSVNENVINQGLFYYDWLVDHKAEFQLLVMEKLGEDQPEQIEWDAARLICIASGFDRYDEYAIKQIDRNIDLIRYQYFGDDMFLLELVSTNAKKSQKRTRKSVNFFKTSEPASKTASTSEQTTPNKKINYADKYHTDILEILQSEDPELLQRFELVCEFCQSLGEEVQRKELKLYTAFKRLKNFASCYVLPGKRAINLYLKVDPDTIELQNGFSQDARGKGHWGTGDLEIIISSDEDVEKAKPLITMSFENS